MMKAQEIALILDELCKLKEDDFRKLIVNFFRLLGAKADETHGTNERGADILAVFENEEDVIGRQMIIFVQAKVGNINLSKWRENLCAQMSQLYYRPPEMTTSISFSPRRILLITTGKINNEVKTEITNWNSKLPIPIEAFSGNDFAELIHYHNRTADDVKKLLDPKVPPTKPQITGIATTSPLPSVRVERIGSEDPATIL